MKDPKLADDGGLALGKRVEVISRQRSRSDMRNVHIRRTVKVVMYSVFHCKSGKHTVYSGRYTV